MSRKRRTPRRHQVNTVDPRYTVRTYQRGLGGARTVPSPLFSFRGDIGHYGGYFIDVPVSEFGDFKKLFGRTFPRATNIRGFGKGGIRYKTVFFAEGTKGLTLLEKLEREGRVKLDITW